MEELKRQQVYKKTPKLSNDPDIQLNRAYLWHVGWGWTKNDACEKSGCTLFRLTNAVTAGGPNNVAKPGGQSLLTETVINAVLVTLTLGAMTISAVSLEMGNPNSLYEIIRKEIQNQQSNKLAVFNLPDWKTQKAWAALILERGDCARRKAELKARGRKKPFLNLRNNVAYAAVVRCLFVHRNVHPEMLMSTDDVAIIVHASMSDIKPIVIAPKVALKWLAENGIGVSTSAQELYKQRMITFKISITRSYDVCTVMIVYDRALDHCKNKPTIYSMGARFYIALAHPGIDQQILEEYIECGCILPEADMLR